MRLSLLFSSVNILISSTALLLLVVNAPAPVGSLTMIAGSSNRPNLGKIKTTTPCIATCKTRALDSRSSIRHETPLLKWLSSLVYSATRRPCLVPPSIVFIALTVSLTALPPASVAATSSDAPATKADLEVLIKRIDDYKFDYAVGKPVDIQHINAETFSESNSPEESDSAVEKPVDSQHINAETFSESNSPEESDSAVEEPVDSQHINAKKVNKFNMSEKTLDQLKLTASLVISLGIGAASILYSKRSYDETLEALGRDTSSLPMIDSNVVLPFILYLNLYAASFYGH